MHEVVQLGFHTGDYTRISSCKMVSIASVFQVHAVSMHHVCDKDMIFDNATLKVSFYRCKDNGFRRPLMLRYRDSHDWPPMDNTLQFIIRWHFDKHPDGSFGMSLSTAPAFLFENHPAGELSLLGSKPTNREVQCPFGFWVLQGIDPAYIGLRNRGDDACQSRQPFRRGRPFWLVRFSPSVNISDYFGNFSISCV